MGTRAERNSGLDLVGQALVVDGTISDEQLTMAQDSSAASGESLGRVLVDMALVDETDWVVKTAQVLGNLYVELDEYPVDAEAANLLTVTLALRYQAVPIGWEDGFLLMAMANPSDLFAVDDLRIITGADLRIMVATPTGIAEAITRWLRSDVRAARLVEEATADLERAPGLGAGPDEAPIVQLVDVIINQAMADRASDVHFEPTAHDLRVRFRIDGVLHEIRRLPRTMQAPILSRLKIMAELDISERRLPQDGRVSATLGGRSVDLRVATLPTVHGEQITIRLLDRSGSLLTLDQLGFDPETAKAYQNVFRRPYGTILVTGPTGSGKSTTLYATASALNGSDRKIITVEDPVEYQLPGISQVQVNAKAGLTFAVALRSMLRSDPDVMLVGEIRDRETAAVAVEAALTGHLVLATLHTNDAASAPIRLAEMGLEPYLVSMAIDGVIAQRLARRLCDRCREPYTASSAEVTMVGGDWGQEIELHRAVGCTHCVGTGYRGRVAIHELLVVSEQISHLIADNRPAAELRQYAMEQGMQPLREAGMVHVRAGTTSLEELLRVVV